MKDLLFITDFSEASKSALKRIYPLSKQLGMKLKIVQFSPSRETKVLDNQYFTQEKINGFLEHSLGFRPPNQIKSMGMKGSLQKVITETGRYFDLIVISDKVDKELLRKSLFEENNFSSSCPILLLPDSDQPFHLKKAIYIGTQFNELDWGLRRQLRNICRRSNAELQIAQPLLEKDRWFYSKTPFSKSKFLTELGWFRGLFFDKLKKHLQTEKIDVAVLSPHSLKAAWLSKRMFVWKAERLNVPILVLPRKLSKSVVVKKELEEELEMA